MLHRGNTLFRQVKYAVPLCFESNQKAARKLPMLWSYFSICSKRRRGPTARLLALTGICALVLVLSVFAH